MFAYGDSFIYAGVDSKDYNVILCSFDGEDDNSGNFGLEREIISEDFNGRLKKTHYGAKYTAPLEFKITIVKNPCNNDRNYFIYDEIRDINSWLTAYEFPQKLYINSEYLHDVYFNAIFSNIEFRRINGEIVALTFTVTCDSPYAWEDFNRIYDCSSGETQITFYNNSDEKNKLFYPNIKILSYSPTPQPITIINTSTDDENNKVIFKGVNITETITMFGDNLQFISTENISKYQNDVSNNNGYFNFEWLYMKSGKNILTVNGACQITISGAYPRKVGVN